MRYEDSQLLQKWAALQLAIAAARSARELGHAPSAVDGSTVSPDNLLTSRGYRALRAWFLGLSPGAKARARTWMTTQLDGVAKLREKLEAEGSRFDYGDLDELEFDTQEAGAGDTKE